MIVTFAERYLLADAGVSGKNIGVLCNGKSRWAAVRDLQDTPPFGEATTVFLVLGTTLREPIKTYRGTSHKMLQWQVSPS